LSNVICIKNFYIKLFLFCRC